MPRVSHGRVGGSRSLQAVLPVVLITAMVASTFHMFAIGVLASSIIEDLGVSRWTLGLIGSVNPLVGAVTAPRTGALTDKIGPRRSIVAVCALGALGMGLMATAQSVAWLVLSAVVSGLPQGWGNPATNALIAQRSARGQRGTITGVKQSGVTVALFLSGAALPTLALRSDWHRASWIFAGVFCGLTALNAVLLSGRFTSPIHPTTTPKEADSGPTRAEASAADPQGVPTFVKKMTIYAFLMGMSSGAIGRFLPLFAEEALGMARTPAGALMAVVGLGGVVFRIAAARLADGRVHPQRLLRILATIAVATSLLLAAASTVGVWVLWVVSVLYALGHISWNSVVHLAIINERPHDAGKQSGIVMLGFLLGMTLGSPLTGFVVDTWGTYQPVWVAAALLAALSVAVTRPTVSASQSE